MANYTKLFNSIITSTIWTEDDKTRIVWITMLAIADQHGEVQASIPGLARVSGVSLEAAENAINKFLAPDPYSRTPDDEGRRIEKIEGGWALLNHGKYRLMASAEDSKKSNADRQKRHRDKKNRNANVTESNACVTLSNGQVTVKTDIAEAEAEAEAKAKTKYNTPTIEGACVIESPFSESPPEAGITMQQLMDKINELRPAWKRVPRWNRNEMESLRNGSASQIQSLTDDDWQLLKAFYDHPDDKAWFKFEQRSKLVENIASTLSNADKWKKATGYKNPNSTDRLYY
jgi:hypothetical protein